MFFRNPEVIDAWMEKGPDYFSGIQKEIITRASDMLRPGGMMMYSTCTLVHAENEGMVASFLNDHPEFSLEPLPLPDVFPENISGMQALIPGEYDTDGFFISRLRRTV